MTKEKLSRQELLEKYKAEIEYLSRYIPWFEKHSADKIASMYKGDGTGNGFSFPVYDSTLLSFINDVGMSSFMDRNYRYVYSRYFIRNYKDEWRAIDNTTIMDMEVIGAILSKYVLGGMTRASLWKEAVQYGIFLRCIKKAKQIIEFWDIPIQDNFELLEEERAQDESGYAGEQSYADESGYAGEQSYADESGYAEEQSYPDESG
ncbi:MAG: hypothetical protein J6P60_06390, partial [Lachnospiraceae bacterium]|nr:hypothetical protein [Lachnospiraceae bacterium]